MGKHSLLAQVVLAPLAEAPPEKMVIKRDNNFVLTSSLNGACYVAVKYESMANLWLYVDGELVATGYDIIEWLCANFPKSLAQAQRIVERSD